MDDTVYDGHDELYITVQSLVKIAQCAPAVGAKMWCLIFLFVGHALSPFDGCIVRTSIALPFIGRFRRGLQRFFHKGLHFQTRYIVLTFFARWRHNFREIAVKNCEKSKKSAEKFVRSTSYR